MEISFTRTVEYSLMIDDDDHDGLAALDGILRDHQVDGDSLYERVQTVHGFDPQDVIVALVDRLPLYVEEMGDSYMTDGWDCDGLTDRWGGPCEDEPSDEPTLALM